MGYRLDKTQGVLAEDNVLACVLRLEIVRTFAILNVCNTQFKAGAL